MDFAVVRVHPDLVRYAVALQRRNSGSVGFLPHAVFERGAARGRLFLGLLNGEPCGYILTNGGWQGVLRCVQVAIQYDVRRRLYGAMLVQAAEDYGLALGCVHVQLRCGRELPANAFWGSLGYFCTGTAPAGAAAKRFSCLNLWAKTLHPTTPATAWKTGRPRVYVSNAARQAAYRLRNFAAVRVPSVTDR
jgi:GNAT superfamily N-acetyltransferase